MVYRVEFNIDCKNDNIFTSLESLGDFLILSKNEYVLRTTKSKTVVRNNFKKILSETDTINITTVPKEGVGVYSDVVKSWLLLEETEKKIKNISIKDVEKEALTRLDSFISILEKELQNENSDRKED